MAGNIICFKKDFTHGSESGSPFSDKVFFIKVACDRPKSNVSRMGKSGQGWGRRSEATLFSTGGPLVASRRARFLDKHDIGIYWGWFNSWIIRETKKHAGIQVRQN